ncbi:F0F1 ATP synthase subunit B [Sphingomonas spermidinifaciens]|uniref:ATP synthase subunit b n=2 Tax=Sphingomonas spermidinifaciens TaxID=1141889 RepID=A0A2A4B528_9SPHN|nr:F0F1 ATP synthase subunit B [Sphingomonas spermidinifaciens]PCD02848.1 F0F1 ATP synthase subunit B [Sphingomonas spermidinifaciens]
MPETGVNAIETHGEAVPHSDPTALFLDPTGWVSAAMAVFILILLWKGVPKLIGRMLDGQIAAIRSRLDEAKQLRAEAEALKAEYQAKLASAEADAAAMVAHAEEEARALRTKAEADAAELVQRRAKMAEDKIAAAERQAIADIRVKTADAAAKAAAAILAKKHDAAADRALVDRTIAGLVRPN